jgi:hypothetical protein
VLFLSAQPTLMHDQESSDHFCCFGTEIIIDLGKEDGRPLPG